MTSYSATTWLPFVKLQPSLKAFHGCQKRVKALHNIIRLTLGQFFNRMNFRKFSSCLMLLTRDSIFSWNFTKLKKSRRKQKRWRRLSQNSWQLRRESHNPLEKSKRKTSNISHELQRIHFANSYPSVLSTQLVLTLSSKSTLLKSFITFRNSAIKKLAKKNVDVENNVIASYNVITKNPLKNFHILSSNFSSLC